MTELLVSRPFSKRNEKKEDGCDSIRAMDLPRGFDGGRKKVVLPIYSAVQAMGLNSIR